MTLIRYGLFQSNVVKSGRNYMAPDGPADGPYSISQGYGAHTGQLKVS